MAKRHRSRDTRLATLVAAFVLVALGLLPSGLTPSVRAAADPSDVVIVMDFSASILQDTTNRNRFGAALEQIAGRVDEISADLVAGDVTVSLVQFATRAADVPTCVDLKLLGNATQVGHFADCLRSVAAAYRKGLTTALTKQIGVDTNYVAAMQRAAVHLPPDAARPALILFTDGKHDVPGVPVTQVEPTRNQLFGARTPFALLPVGMGLAAGERAALESGLERLRITRDMPACVSGATFDWPTVVFDTPAAAGNAVGVALQEATCTVYRRRDADTATHARPGLCAAHRLQADAGETGPSPLPGLPPRPEPPSPRSSTGRPAAVRVTVSGDWVESAEGVSLDTTATISALTNGTSYSCEVSAVGSSSSGAWTTAGTVTPIGRPAAPAKIDVSPLDQAIQVAIDPVGGGVTGYAFECSPDGGATWPIRLDTSAASTTALVKDVQNGVTYVCRAFASNPIGVSDASPVSSAVKPCNSLFECSSAMLPLFGGLAVLLIGGVLLALVALVRGRTTGHVIAVVDVVHTANIGHGSSLGISFGPAAGRPRGHRNRRRPRQDRGDPDSAEARRLRRRGSERPARGRGRDSAGRR